MEFLFDPTARQRKCWNIVFSAETGSTKGSNTIDNSVCLNMPFPMLDAFETYP